MGKVPTTKRIFNVENENIIFAAMAFSHGAQVAKIA